MKLCKVISSEMLTSCSRCGSATKLSSTFGRFNWHSNRIWGLGNPAEIHEHKRDMPKLFVWCAISSAGLIGPLFFRDREGHSVNVNSDDYLRML